MNDLQPVELIAFVADWLEELVDKVVFLGGAVVGSPFICPPSRIHFKTILNSATAFKNASPFKTLCSFEF